MIAPYFDPQGFVQQSCFPLILPLVSENDYRKKIITIVGSGILSYIFFWVKKNDFTIPERGGCTI